MLNKEKHKLLMIKILKDIYTDTEIASLLGFKGGTAAYLFYGLTRFSVDLDFDLLEDNSDESVEKFVFDKIKTIASKYGKIKNDYIKEKTIFLILSYGEKEHNIKIEISTRKTVAKYAPRNFLGITMNVIEKESLFAGKLIALLRRNDFAARDVYDIRFFLSNGDEIDGDYLKSWGVENKKQYLKDCAGFIEKVSNNKMMSGLGELVNENEKDYIRNNLKEEAIFLLNAYAESLND